MSNVEMTNAEAARRAMVASQLRTSAVSDTRIVAAMAAVPREDFVPGSDATLAYRDRALPLPGGRAQNPPLATGRLLSEAAIEPGDRVLLIGAAGGYTAAVLAGLAKEVVAVESDEVLVAHARNALADYSNVSLVEGELAAGSPDQTPYDILVVDGAIERLPDALARQLKDGGRFVCGLVEGGLTRLASGVRSAGGATPIAFADVECAILPGFAVPRAFHFPR